MRPSDACETIEHLPHTADKDLLARPRIGVVALASDYTIEAEFRTLLGAEPVEVFTSRIENSPEVTPETLAAMGPRLTGAADLLLPGDRLDVVAYGCTSATAVMGEDAVAARIRAAKPMAQIATPLGAAKAALHALGARRVAVLTPYTRDVNETLRAQIAAGGFEIPVFGSFNEPLDPVVAAIDAESLRAAVRRLAAAADIDAVFVSCTSIRFADAVPALEAELGLPVTTSNHALAWRCLRLAGLRAPRPELGRLYAL